MIDRRIKFGSSHYYVLCNCHEKPQISFSKIIAFLSKGSGNFQNDAMPSFAPDSKIPLYKLWKRCIIYSRILLGKWRKSTKALSCLEGIPSQLHTTVYKTSVVIYVTNVSYFRVIISQGKVKCYLCNIIFHARVECYTNTIFSAASS